MDNLYLYQVKYKLKTPKAWKLYQANIVSYDISFINRELYKRYGNSFEIMDTDSLGKINLIDRMVIEDLLTENLSLFESIKAEKNRETEIQKKDLNKCIERGKQTFYEIDKTLNDGKESMKESIWSYT